MQHLLTAFVTLLFVRNIDHPNFIHRFTVPPNTYERILPMELPGPETKLAAWPSICNLPGFLFESNRYRHIVPYEKLSQHEITKKILAP